MKLNVLEKKKHRLLFELRGADHTFSNALKHELWKEKDVKVATYAIKHPLLAVPTFIIETREEEAVKALEQAAASLSRELKRQSTAFLNAV